MINLVNVTKIGVRNILKCLRMNIGYVYDKWRNRSKNVKCYIYMEIGSKGSMVAHSTMESEYLISIRDCLGEMLRRKGSLLISKWLNSQSRYFAIVMILLLRQKESRLHYEVWSMFSSSITREILEHEDITLNKSSINQNLANPYTNPIDSCLTWVACLK